MSISEVIKKLVVEWGKHPTDINAGECGDFADEVAKLVQDAHFVHCNLILELFCIKNLDYTDHNMIEYRGRYYDAECPDGVDHPELLPIFLRQWAPDAQELFVTLIGPNDDSGESHDEEGIEDNDDDELDETQEESQG